MPEGQTVECYGKKVHINDNLFLWDMLRKVVPLAQTTDYLEIGTREGCSLRVVLEAGSSITEVTVVDPFNARFGGTGRGNPTHIYSMLRDMQWDGEAQCVVKPSVDALPYLILLKRHYGLITVDGDHRVGNVVRDACMCLALLRDNAWIVFDDIAHPAHPRLGAEFTPWFESEFGHRILERLVDMRPPGVVAYRMKR